MDKMTIDKSKIHEIDKFFLNQTVFFCEREMLALKLGTPEWTANCD